MAKLKYTVIKDSEQYNEYCNALEKLAAKDDDSFADEIDLLTVLIEKWDNEHNTFEENDPVELLKSLMEANDMVEILGLTKGTVSKILNYQKGFSKEVIRKLAEYFKVSQEAFNRPYRLVNTPAPRTTTPPKRMGKRLV